MAAPTTSGAADFKLDILEICEEAYELAGGEMKTGYHLRTARRSLQVIALEWANRGINLWTMTEATIATVASTDTYNLADDTIDVLQMSARKGSGTSQADYSLTRMSISTYAQKTNKLTEARPTEFYVDRQNRPTVTVWPVPSDTTYTLVYWYLRRIEDAGTNTNNYDMPERFIPALISGLAFKLAVKGRGLEARASALKTLYDQEFQQAADEDRDKSSTFLVPRIAMI